jgi:hypothetical protein
MLVSPVVVLFIDTLLRSIATNFVDTMLRSIATDFSCATTAV